MKKLTWKKFDPTVMETVPGMLLKVRDESGRSKKKPIKTFSIYLVGYVNKALGVCDDCTRFDIEDIIEYSTDFVEEISKHLGTFYEKPSKK